MKPFNAQTVIISYLWDETQILLFIMRKLKLSIISILSLLLAISCSQKPDSHEAEVSEAQEVSTVSADAMHYKVDTSASQINWFGFKPAGQHTGIFSVEQGHLSIEDGQVVGGSFVFDLEKVNVQDLQGEDRQKLTGHLKSEDFFYTEKYPTAKFVITNVEKYNGGALVSSEEENDDMNVVVNDEEIEDYKINNPTHTITGNLTMRDTTLSISFPAEIAITDEYAEAQAKFSIDRTKWNISYNDESDPVRVAKDKFIYNTVNVGLDIIANKEDQTATEDQAESEPAS